MQTPNQITLEKLEKLIELADSMRARLARDLDLTEKQQVELADGIRDAESILPAISSINWRMDKLVKTDLSLVKAN